MNLHNIVDFHNVVELRSNALFDPMNPSRSLQLDRASHNNIQLCYDYVARVQKKYKNSVYALNKERMFL